MSVVSGRPHLSTGGLAVQACASSASAKGGQPLCFTRNLSFFVYLLAVSHNNYYWLDLHDRCNVPLGKKVLTQFCNSSRSQSGLQISSGFALVEVRPRQVPLSVSPSVLLRLFVWRSDILSYLQHPAQVAHELGPRYCCLHLPKFLAIYSWTVVRHRYHTVSYSQNMVHLRLA